MRSFEEHRQIIQVHHGANEATWFLLDQIVQANLIGNIPAIGALLPIDERIIFNKCIPNLDCHTAADLTVVFKTKTVPGIMNIAFRQSDILKQIQSEIGTSRSTIINKYSKHYNTISCLQWFCRDRTFAARCMIWKAKLMLPTMYALGILSHLSVALPVWQFLTHCWDGTWC